MNNDKVATTSGDIRELVHIVNNQLDPITTSSTVSSTRIYTPPLMGTSARAAKRRIDGDTGPIRIEGTDTYNQQLQHHYHNVRQILEDQQPNQTSNIDQSNESRQSFSAKRDFFEQRFKSSPSTYDSPPREQQPLPKIITTITTTTTKTPNTKLNQTNSSLNESPPSVDRLLEQGTELQKLTNVNSIKNDSQQPLVTERTDQYKVFLDPNNHEVSRIPTVPITKTGHATDLDQVQAQVDRLADDHKAIQQLTRVLQEHNTTTPNEYKRLPSQPTSFLINTITTTTTTIPSNVILADRTNKPKTTEFTVIDALLDNPLGTNNTKQNNLLHTRVNDILSNLRNHEYVNSLKQSLIKKTKKKKFKKPKTKTKKTKPVLVDKQTQFSESMLEPTSISSEQTLLLSSKEKKKHKKKIFKIKSKRLSKNTAYQVIDAIISSPISLRLPTSYLMKYKVNPPLSQLSPISSITSKDYNIPISQQMDTKAKKETDYNLVKVVNEVMLHHAAAVTASVNTRTKGLPHYEPIKPRIVYRYMDEQGHILKLSSTPPSQLREITSEQSQYPYRTTEPTYFRSRQIAIDDERRHLIPEREQRTTWQEESKLPTTITREDLELRDKRIPQLSEQPLPTTRTIPVSIEREKVPSQQQQRIYHYPNQQNVNLNWLPLSYQLDQPYRPNGTVGYDTDSTNSEHSITYRPYDYALTDNHYRYNNRPLLQNIYYNNRSPDPFYHPSSPPVSYGGRRISPEYGGNSSPRNYIEIFRDGETRPSEVYSLPLNEPISTSHRHSRYDQYQSEKHGKNPHSSTSPNARHEKTIPTSSSSSSHRDPYHPQSSPNRDSNYFDNYLRQSKSFDYRPLRTKLQREYKITPSLLVDEWDHPQQSTSTDYNKQTSISLPDEVFINNNRINKA